MNRDNRFLQSLGIKPYNLHGQKQRTWGAADTARREDQSYDWTEHDIRSATMDMDEIRATRELINKKDALIGNLSRTVELMEKQEKKLRSIISQWKRLACAALLMAAGFLTGAIMLAKGVR
jgi:wobble nucleotide-excising tRNase